MSQENKRRMVAIDYDCRMLPEALQMKIYGYIVELHFNNHDVLSCKNASLSLVTCNVPDRVVWAEREAEKKSIAKICPKCCCSFKDVSFAAPKEAFLFGTETFNNSKTFIKLI